MPYARRSTTGGAGSRVSIKPEPFRAIYDLTNGAGADYLPYTLFEFPFGAQGETFPFTIWAQGLISLGDATDAQRTFMNSYTGGSLADFPGAYVAIGGSATEY